MRIPIEASDERIIKQIIPVAHGWRYAFLICDHPASGPVREGIDGFGVYALPITGQALIEENGQQRIEWVIYRDHELALESDVDMGLEGQENCIVLDALAPGEPVPTPEELPEECARLKESLAYCSAA